MQRQHRFLLICVLVLAAVLRFVLVIRHLGAPLGGDECGYDSIAWSLVTGHGYARVDDLGNYITTAVRGPSYPILLALLYMIAGHNVAVPLFLQVLLDVGSCYLTFCIGRYIFKRLDAAILGAFLYAIFPQFVMNTQLILTETFVIFLMLLGILNYLKFSATGNRTALVVCAVAIGVTSLSRPVLCLIPVLLFLADTRGGIWKGAKAIAVQLIIIFLLTLPWIVRNALVFHKFIPTATSGGIVFWLGSNQPVDGVVIAGLGDPGAPEYAREAVEGLSETESEKWFYRDGKRIIMEDPKGYASLLVHKLPTLWFNLPLYGKPTPGNWIMLFFRASLLIAAAIGAFAYKPPAVASRLLLVLVVYFTVVHLLYFATFRYTLPVYAYALPFSGAGAVAVVERLGLARLFGKKKSA